MAAQRLTEEQITEQLKAYKREPFGGVLSRMLAAEPTPKAMRRFAAKAPDRWAQSVTQFAKLAGFNEKIEIDGNITITKLSDSEVAAKIEEIKRIALSSNENDIIEINPSNQADQPE